MVRVHIKYLEFTPQHLVSCSKVSVGSNEKRRSRASWILCSHDCQPLQDLTGLLCLWGVRAGQEKAWSLGIDKREIEMLIRTAKSPHVNYPSSGDNSRLMEVIALFIWVIRKQRLIKGGKSRRRCRIMRWVTRGTMPLIQREILGGISWLGINNILISGKPWLSSMRRWFLPLELLRCHLLRRSSVITETESHEGAIMEAEEEACESWFIDGEIGRASYNNRALSWEGSWRGVCGTTLNPSATILFPKSGHIPRY